MDYALLIAHISDALSKAEYYISDLEEHLYEGSDEEIASEETQTLLTLTEKAHEIEQAFRNEALELQAKGVVQLNGTCVVCGERFPGVLLLEDIAQDGKHMKKAPVCEMCERKHGV